MNIQLRTLDEVNTFINKANTLLGYPDGKGTETYCLVPELTEVKDENGNIIESYYELPITTELNELLIQITTKNIIDNETNSMV